MFSVRIEEIRQIPEKISKMFEKSNKRLEVSIIGPEAEEPPSEPSQWQPSHVWNIMKVQVLC